MENFPTMVPHKNDMSSLIIYPYLTELDIPEHLIPPNPDESDSGKTYQVLRLILTYFL